ncbi:MAG: hypothetical protein JNL11_16575 [Bdellovibrionaceae bacterium]|nr:hypothetical protein [Pseudobdellovibrionaceae bacterium]
MSRKTAYRSKWHGIFLITSLLFVLGCMQNALNIPAVSSNVIQGNIDLGHIHSIQKVSAFSCSDAKLYLYRLDENGDRMEPEIDIAYVKADGSYSFDLKNKNVLFAGKSPREPLIIQMKGCLSDVYFRPVTSATGQTISMGSTVLGFMLNTSAKSRLAQALISNQSQLDVLLNILKDADSLDNAFESLSSNQAVAMKFIEIFGAEPAVLTQASPEVVSESVPERLSELVSASFSVTTNHFSKNYQIFYEWTWDSQIVGHTAQVSFSPGANSQGKHTLSLKLGEKDGNTFKDGVPSKTISWLVHVDNNVLPTPPSLILQSPVVAHLAPISTRSVNLGIQTGNQLSQCSSFSYLALSEGSASQSPPDSAYTMSCFQSGVQILNYNLQSPGDGIKSIYLWAKDSAGVVSGQPSLLEVNLDTQPPMISIITQPAAHSDSGTATFSFTATDALSGVHRFECQLDNAGYSTCSSPVTYTNLIEGTHDFDVKAYDVAGNSSIITRKTWLVDKQAPVLTLVSKPASLTNQTLALFSFTAVDSSSGVYQVLCNWDGAGYDVCMSPVQKTITAGQHQFSIKAVDLAGNVSVATNYNWILDVTEPTVTITSKPLSLTNSPSANFGFVGTDSGGGHVAHYECRLDSATFSNCQDPVTYQNLLAGSHSFQVRAIDSAGNVGQPAAYTWTVDLTTPIASINSGPSTLTNQTVATFTFSANNPPDGGIAGYECQLDSSAWTGCSSPKTHSSLSAGAHTFSVRSIDNNANRSAVVNYTWTVDLSPPTVSVTSEPALMTNLTSANFVFHGSDTGGGGIASYLCKTDAAAYAGCSSPVSLSTLAEGSHNFYLKAIDTAGNTSAVYTYTWTVDLTPPALSLTSQPDAVTGSASAVFNFVVTDNNANNIASTMCSLDGQTYQPCSTSASYSSLTPGIHQWALISTDNAGNSSASLVYSWTIDQTPPTVAVTFKPNTYVNSTSASFSFSATDAGGGVVAQYLCALDSASFTACSSPVAYTSLAQGSSPH